ncbi:hypothetical protein GCM10027415_04290 [Humibacter ginsengisoli]
MRAAVAGRPRRLNHMLVTLELVFVGLLSLAVLAIAGVSVLVVYNLFRGQR